HARYYGEVRGEKNKTDPMNFDRITYRPVLAVGRWPVSTESEARTVAAKTIAYERGLAAGSKPGMDRAALFAVGGWMDSRGLFDGLADRLRPRWSVEKSYYHGEGRDDTTPPDEARLDEILNQGAGLVIHAGHGSDTTWHACFALPNLSRVKNSDRLPVMISAGCSTARLCTLPPY